MRRKVYQEGHGASFKTKDAIYDLNGIFSDTNLIPANNMPTATLMSSVPSDLTGPAVETVDETIPVLVAILNGKATIVDGRKRVAKRRILQMEKGSKFPATTPYKLIPAEVMKKCLIWSKPK